jgi:hypothetical protein
MGIGIQIQSLKGDSLAARLYICRLSLSSCTSPFIYPTIFMRNSSITERQHELPLDTANSATSSVHSGYEASRHVGDKSTRSVEKLPGDAPRPTDARVYAESGRTLVREMLALAVHAIEKQDRNECERYTMMALRMVREVPSRTASEPSGNARR